MDLVFETRQEAEKVLSIMKELIKQYAAVSANDLETLIGRPTLHNGDKIGWVSLDKAVIRLTTDENYLLVLPMPEPINVSESREQVEFTKFHTVYDLIKEIAQYPPDTKIHCLSDHGPIGIIRMGDPEGGVTDIVFASIKKLEEHR